MKAHLHSPASNHEAKVRLPGKRDFARRMKGGAAERLRTPSSFHLACGGILLRFRQKRRRARQSQQRQEALAAKEGGSSTRPENSPNKAQRGLGGERGKREKIHPSSSPLPGAGDRWSRAPPYWEKMGFRGANLNSSAKATGTETLAGENAQELGDERCTEKGGDGRGHRREDGPRGGAGVSP